MRTELLASARGPCPVSEPGSGGCGRNRIEEAARQFEALMITQLLRASRPAEAGGWLGTGDDQSATPAMEMAEESFAQSMAAQGGLGLAALIVAGLEPQDQALQPAGQVSSAAGSSGQGGMDNGGAG